MLWAVANVDGQVMYAKCAYATPFRGYAAKFAAEQLLAATWKAEFELLYEDLRGACVDEEGLLTKTDIERIERETFSELE